MSDPTSATAPVKFQGKLSGFCLENTVIDRKGRIRKIKPPSTASKPVPAPPTPRLETYLHEPRHLSPSSSNVGVASGSRPEEIFDNRRFVVGNNNVDISTQTQHHTRHSQRPEVVNTKHREPIWKEGQSSRSFANTSGSKTDDGAGVLGSRRENPQVIPSATNRESQNTDNYFGLKESAGTVFNTEKERSQNAECLLINRPRYVHQSKEFSNASHSALEPTETRDSFLEGILRAAAGTSAVQCSAERDIIQGVTSNKEVLLNNANLNWKPQRVQKQSIKKITETGLSDRNSQTAHCATNDIYEMALNRLEAEIDTDDDDDDDDDDDVVVAESDDRSAECGRRSESPDTLVERILENVDETDMIVDFDFDEENDNEGKTKIPNQLQSHKKSFSDEILERIGSPERNSQASSNDPCSRIDSKKSRTLEPVEKDQNVVSNNLSTQRNLQLQAECSNSKWNSSSTEIKPNSYFIEQLNADNSVHNGSGNSSSDSTVVPLSSVSGNSLSSGSASILSSGPPSTPGPPLLAVKSRDEEARSSRERSPEEIFEEIMESIHDTEGDYEEPFFMKWPSLLLRKGNSLQGQHGDRSRPPIDYSVENDWLSFFYCNRIDADKDTRTVPSANREDRGMATGIFLNTSLSSSSWIESKPSRGTYPRTSSSKSKPHGKTSATVNVTSEQVVEPDSMELLEGMKQFPAEKVTRDSIPSTSYQYRKSPGSDSTKLSTVEQTTNKFQKDFRMTNEAESVGTQDQIHAKQVSEAAGQLQVEYSPSVRNESSSHATKCPRPPVETQQEERKKIPTDGESQASASDRNSPTTLLFAALDSAFARSIQQNMPLLETRKPDEDISSNTDGTLTPDVGSSADDIAESSESTIRLPVHGMEARHSNESRMIEISGDCRSSTEINEFSLDSNDAKLERHAENLTTDKDEKPEIRQGHELTIPSANDSSEMAECVASVSFIDEPEMSEITPRGVLDAIDECDDDECLDDRRQTQEESPSAVKDNRDCSAERSELAAELMDQIFEETLSTEPQSEHSDVVQQPPPKRSVRILSDEVISQTVVLKIAWPSGRTRDRGQDRKDQPFRELQLRRTIRMAEPGGQSSKGPALTNDPEGRRLEQGDLKEPVATTTTAVARQNRTLNSVTSVASRPDVVVEYENREQSRREEPAGADASVDVTQTDSVKVLLVPAETSYQVPDLKEIVTAVGQTILQDSRRIPTSSNIRVTCEAIQSKSCAALKNHDVTVINDTIFDATQNALQSSTEG